MKVIRKKLLQGLYAFFHCRKCVESECVKAVAYTRFSIVENV